MNFGSLAVVKGNSAPPKLREVVHPLDDEATPEIPRLESHPNKRADPLP